MSVGRMGDGLGRREVLVAGLGVGWGLCTRRALGQATKQDDAPGGSHRPLPPLGKGGREMAALDEALAKFMEGHQPPGMAVAVTYRGRLVYARGFGFADVEKQEPVRPESLFRIASLSKTFTSAAVMKLVEAGKIKLDDRVLPIIKIEPFLENGASLDKRWNDITVRQCLQHTAGFDRGKGFDPMAAVTAEETAAALKVPLPVTHTQIIQYSMGKPLDFDPGTAYVYSNFGYCLLGRVIEAVSGQAYPEFVRKEVLAPVGIKDMRLGKNLLEDRAAGEVKYYDSRGRRGRAISGPQIGKRVPLPYGVECIETMDANGGWIASAVDLMRFAVALENPKKCPILKEATIAAMLAPPPGKVGHEADGRAKRAYYACGWNVHTDPGRPGQVAKAHGGLLAGSSTTLNCGDDGINWTALFNCDADQEGKEFGGVVGGVVRQALAGVKEWPEGDLFRGEK